MTRLHGRCAPQRAALLAPNCAIASAADAQAQALGTLAEGYTMD